MNAIYSGVPWFDEKGEVVSAHGACIVQDAGRYCFFGEKHVDTSNAFTGFNCYSSADLYNWKYESLALPVQSSGKLGPRRVGERVKVMKCPATGEYVMYMHADTLGYTDQFVGYATSKNIAGPYNFQGPLLFNDKPIRKWDMGTFQDSDGEGYILIHGGEIYQLGPDYKSVTAQLNKNMVSGFESPAMFRKDSIYYLLGSDLTSWEKNDNYYFTATSIKGPWTKRGFFCPAGTLTWNSQTTFVLPVVGSKETTYMFMGDRWSFPKQASAATYIWQPLTVSGFILSIPQFRETWQINTVTGKNSVLKGSGKIIKNTDKSLVQQGKWSVDTLSFLSSDEQNASVSIKFNGSQIGWHGLSRPTGGYAGVTILNSKAETILSTIVDMYCKYPLAGPKFLSPVMPRDTYTLMITVMGERPNWSDKRKTNYGSTGYFISLDKLVVRK
ncbi:MAG: family 43 glycosylhydrolase [Bacteroidota bacterium]